MRPLVPKTILEQTWGMRSPHMRDHLWSHDQNSIHMTADPFADEDCNMRLKTPEKGWYVDLWAVIILSHIGHYLSTWHLWQRHTFFECPVTRSVIFVFIQRRKERRRPISQTTKKSIFLPLHFTQTRNGWILYSMVHACSPHYHSSAHTAIPDLLNWWALPKKGITPRSWDLPH